MICKIIGHRYISVKLYLQGYRLDLSLLTPITDWSKSSLGIF